MSDGPRTRPGRAGAGAIAQAVAASRTSAVSVAQDALGRITNGESGPERLNAVISWNHESALAAAHGVDGRAAAGDGSRMPLAGVPVAVKDNICTTDLPTTCGSRLLSDYRSPYDATAVQRLRAAGAVIIGKTNLDEFGMGSSTEASAFGPTRNPHDITRVPGGSSGGSAAAVASGMVPAALGSETGGSVRQPAALCGIVGIKPSYGRVSRYGLVAYASSLDQIGVLGRTVADAALLLGVISGADDRDATCSTREVPDFGGIAADPRPPAVVGVPREYFGDGLDPGVRRACDRSLELMRQQGSEIREVSLPHTPYAIPTYYVIATAEASANLARFDGVRYGHRPQGADAADDVYELARSRGFGAEVRRRILLGTYVLSAGYHEEYYGRALRVRSLILQDFERVFADGVDVLFTPTTPATAFLIGSKTADPYAMYLSDVYTVTANLAALPAMSVPIGFSEGLPVGGQIIAPRWAESAMIGAGAVLERAITGDVATARSS